MFSYLIDKIENAQFSREPFSFIYISDLFTSDHFQEIINAPEIRLSACKSDEQLISKLFESSYKVIEFPGCTLDVNEYIEWHKAKSVSHKTNTACESFGIALRLTSPSTTIVRELHEFLNSAHFRQCLAKKFGIEEAGVFYDTGIQKYLDGYEISPHPDIRKKALTFMVNINPSPISEQQDYHTHYMRFKESYNYIQAYWAGNSTQDRSWVPWDWCLTEFKQTKNNSMVIFAPNNNTLHGVRANYDHLIAQRTQLYGNFWHREVFTESIPSWEDLCITATTRESAPWINRVLKRVLPAEIISAIRSHSRRHARGYGDNVISERLKDKQ